MYMYNRYAGTNSWLLKKKKIQIEILYTCTKKQLAMFDTLSCMLSQVEFI